MNISPFRFAPRVDLVLANVKVIRDVLIVINEEFEDELKRLVKEGILPTLKTRIPAIQSWKHEIYEGKTIGLWPDDLWTVLPEEDDGVGICVDFQWGVDPREDGAGACVGIYAPANWPAIGTFKERLFRVLTDSFVQEWDDAGSEDHDEGYLLWTSILYARYADGTSFDLDRFLNDIVVAVSRLVERKSEIHGVVKLIAKSKK